MTSIAELLKKAAVSLSPQKPSRSKWTPFAPVVRELESKGHSVQSAVDWIITEGGILASNRSSAYRSLRQLFARQNPKPQS